MNMPPEDSLKTQGSLLERLKDLDDAESWQRFYSTYKRAVAGLARKRGLTDAEAEEVAQEVFKRIAETIHTFEPSSRTGSFRRWLYQLTRWRSEDKIRERGRISVEPLPTPSTSQATSLASRIPAPDDREEVIEAEARRHLVEAALKRIARRVKPRDLQIFQLLVLDEWTPARVAEFLQIKTNHVYVVRHRVGEELRAELERIRKRLASGDADATGDRGI